MSHLSGRGKTIISTVLLLALSLGVSAAPVVSTRSGPVEARLVLEQASILPGRAFTVGLLLRMDPGWHVYWKNPGDSGLPTKISWDMPAGFVAGPLTWPIPERFETEGLVTYGYSGHVLLLAAVTPPAELRDGQVVEMNAKAEWLACRLECIPGSAALGISLPVKHSVPLSDSRWEDSIRAARALIPITVPLARISARADGGQVILRAQGIDIPGAARVVFFPAEAGAISDSAPQTAEVSASSLTLHMKRPPGAQALSWLAGVLAISGQGPVRGFEINVPIASSQAGIRQSAGAVPGTAGFLLALLLAFLGGALLNLMPCVLPVISLKVLSFIRQSAGGEGSGLRHGILFTAGVLASFWLIAAILVALRAGGRLLGWGFQFQDPAVLTITATLFFLIALNLFGVFEVGASFTRLGSRLVGRAGGVGSFLSGLFATAVATPCTAPFMGSALGFALTQPLPVTFGVFTALGLGMSAPYLLLSAFPGLVAGLPKPGKWMETLRQVMGFPMMGAALWMLFVLSALAGSPAVIRVLAALLVSGLGAWIWGRWGRVENPRASRLVSAVLGLMLLVGSTAYALEFVGRAPSLPAATASPGATLVARVASSWEPWSPEREAELRRQGTPVFIDFTARWCLSCQVNERLSLDNPEVRGRFAELGIATLRADWTDRSDSIAQAIAGYGRAGIPLYVLYGRGARDAVILPEILTPGILLAALEKAR